MLEQLLTPSQVGKAKVGGLDLNKARMRWVIEAVITLSPFADGFTASQLANEVRALGKQMHRNIAALLVLREKAIRPLLAAVQDQQPSRGAQNPRPLDTHYHAIHTAMQGVFRELGLVA